MVDDVEKDLEKKEQETIQEISILNEFNELKKQMSEFMSSFKEKEKEKEVIKDPYHTLKSDEEADKLRKDKAKQENEAYQQIQTNLANTEQDLKSLGYGDEMFKLQNMSEYKDTALEYKNILLKRLLVNKLLEAVPQSFDDLTYQEYIKTVKESKNSLTTDMIEAVDKLLPIAKERYKLFYMQSNNAFNNSKDVLKSSDYALNLLNGNKHAEPLDNAIAISLLYPRDKSKEIGNQIGII